MLVIPAIDLIEGKVVRLTQGDYHRKSIYSDNPVEMAKKLKDLGAKRLHIVDLDGARTGEPMNLPIVKKIIEQTGIEIELGGGIRSVETIKKIVNSGVKYVILGTAIYKDKNFAKQSLELFADNVIVGLDAIGDKVKIHGWLKDAENSTTEYLEGFFKEIGVKRILYTDISKDGMLLGPNKTIIKQLLNNTDYEIIAAGGFTTKDDILALKGYEDKGLIGVVVGKAIYEGTIDLSEVFNVV